MDQTVVQRLRITFSRGEPCRYVSHLDLVGVWERLLRRAGVPLAYSEGFSPHPKISMAAPLPVGVTGEGELMDIGLYERWTPGEFAAQIRPQLPAGITVREVYDVPVHARALQAALRFAEYRVLVSDRRDALELRQEIARVLGADHLPREWVREKGVRRYDLRPLIHDLWLAGNDGDYWSLAMTLRTSPEGTGRPEEVLLALGCKSRASEIHRARLVLEEAS